MLPTHSPLHSDFYQFTMAYGYFQLGLQEKPACFQLTFRKAPFGGQFAVACGLQTVIDFIKQWRFCDTELQYLSGLKNNRGDALFSQDFIEYLQRLEFSGSLFAMPEGCLALPHTPLLRVEGPLLQCQLLETAFLNIINFQSLIATKAARICAAAEGDEVIEFGMRRAQGLDGALSATRAAYIGGSVATSNTLAGQLYDIPVRGTHAHSWVTAFPTELEAFSAYAEIMPANCVLLVDTYDTLRGVEHAIIVGNSLRAKGFDLLGVRLDSGDMFALSCEVRKRLDAAGFAATKIMASNSLDEYVIAKLKSQGAPITVWGVGTRMVTAYDQPALDGIYKLGALQNDLGEWEFKLKLSNDKAKITNPGRQQVRRFFRDGAPQLDVIYDVDLGFSDVAVDLVSGAELVLEDQNYIDLLLPVIIDGQLVREPVSIHVCRENALMSCRQIAITSNDHYPVALDAQLYKRKLELISSSLKEQ